MESCLDTDKYKKKKKNAPTPHQNAEGALDCHPTQNEEEEGEEEEEEET